MCFLRKWMLGMTLLCLTILEKYQLVIELK